jgi:UDP-N-acetylglucosamine 2-epimerase (non-hydrolysing)
MSFLHVVGARPNFVKAAAVFSALENHKVQQWIVHTGQHFDDNMSHTFFQELELPAPDFNIKSGNRNNFGTFIGEIGKGIHEFCKCCRPVAGIVYGDVNSSLAGTLALTTLNIPLVHVEAGLRSFDLRMPEETNRIIIDQLSNLLFTSERSANENLKQEGIDENRIYFTGNCMIDTLHRFLPTALERRPWKTYGLTAGTYLLCTMHRPSNVDAPGQLASSVEIVNRIAKIYPVLFPLHPRTGEAMKKMNFAFDEGVTVTPPLSYLSFIRIMAKAAMVLTDSGGVQEETTWLNIPCVTLRANTERPITVSSGTNILTSGNIDELLNLVSKAVEGSWKASVPIEMWDGKAGERMANLLCDFIN